MSESLHLENLKQIRSKVGDGQRLVFVTGFFNIVHPGHLRLLRFAAECGDVLVVGVYGDNIGESLLDEESRLEGIQAIRLIDYSFILKQRPEAFIDILKPDVVVKGKEHENMDNPEADAVKSYGGKLLFSSGDMSFSLAELLQDESLRIAPGGFDRNQPFLDRHGFGPPEIRDILNRFKDLNVLVIGDLIVDEYITCDPIGMSQEDPTVVVSPAGVELYLGGAGIVASHASNLGANVSFLSIMGKDEIRSFVKKKLVAAGVKSYIAEDESRPTILKQRFRCSGKTLLRVNHLRQHPISREIQSALKKKAFRIIPEQDLIIFSDFNYGCLPQPLVDSLVEECGKHNVMMVADSQSSSQVGDVSRFRNMALMTPTEREARLAVKDFESGLVVLAEKLRRKAKAKNIFVTLGKEGLLIHADALTKDRYLTDRIDSMNRNPVDPAGAGDSMLTCASMALASGADIWQSAYMGSVAAACQVARNGNIPLTVNEMHSEAGL